jgi:Spy/CpxP family protein refolding chaperone
VINRRFGRTVLSIGLLVSSASFVAAQAPATPPPAQSQPGQPQRLAWWRDEHYQKHLALTADQVSRLEAIWQAAFTELRKGRDELDRQEAELSRLIETNADENAVVHQVDKVEAIRSRLNKTRQMMIWHHRQLLTPEQRVKFQAMRERDRGRNGAPPAGSTAPAPGGQRP